MSEDYTNLKYELKKAKETAQPLPEAADDPFNGSCCPCHASRPPGRPVQCVPDAGCAACGRYGWGECDGKSEYKRTSGVCPGHSCPVLSGCGNYDVEELRAEGTVCYWPAGGGYATKTRKFNGRSDFTGSKDYIRRCRNILLNMPEQRREVQSRIEKTDDLINRLDHMTLKELLQIAQPEEVFPEHVCAHKLAVFLLRNGLMDETYPSYMNYCYPHSISNFEMNFILSVRNHEALPFTHPLWECERVVKRLLPYEFEQKEIYNYDLMEYFMHPLNIYGDESKRDEKFQALFRQLSDGSGKSWEFIDGFWNQSRNRDSFTMVLCGFWPGFWDFIYQNPSISEEEKAAYFFPKTYSGGHGTRWRRRIDMRCSSTRSGVSP